MDRLLIVGASGLLGSKAMELGHEKFEIYGTYNTHKMQGKSFYELDVMDREAVNAVMENVRPDFVLDTHALHNVDYCETHKEEAWKANVDGTRNVAEAAKVAGAKYAYISTDYVFDGKKLDYTEKDKPNPLSYYARTKLMAEDMLDVLDVNHITIRTAVLYGKGGLGKTPFVLWLVDKLKNKEEVKIVVDQHNNPTLADSVVEAIFKLYKSDATGLFHVTGSDCLSRYDFSVRIAKKFGLNEKLIKPISTPELNQVAPRPEKVKMNNSKIEHATGMKMLSVDEGLEILKKQLVTK